MVEYRALPPECLAPILVAELGPGATNEELARAYRDARADAIAQAATLAACRDLQPVP